jgi:phosphoribosylanthranilate isomerase
MTFIKICGITNLQDALASIEAGADLLGFNFYRPSPRYVEPSVAREIIDLLPKSVLKVGVFVNEPNIESIARTAGVEALQLHGDESPAECHRLRDWHVIKALPVNDDFDLNKLRDYDVNAIMLDTGHKTLRGGTGQVFDWSLAQRANALAIPLFLAGGLSPENVAEAIASVHPYGVDTCSGVEVEPGFKDHARLKAFVKNARSEK